MAWLTLWAWRRDGRQRLRHTKLALLSVGTTAFVGAVVYLTLYRPTLTSDIQDYWKPERLDGAGGFTGLMTRTFDLFVDGVLRLAFPSLQGMARLLAGVLLLVGLGVGTWLVARRFPWLAALPYVGWLGVLAASVVQGWPATPVRVNVPFVLFAYAFTSFGLIHMVTRIRTHRVVAALCLVVALIAFWEPRSDPKPDLVFARGLRQDLQVIRDDSSQKDLVLSYHFMSHWYTHDALVNDARDGQDVTVVRDVRDNSHLYADAKSIAQSTLDAGGTVWCVLPYAMGPTAAGAACHITGPGVVPVMDYSGVQARILGFRLQR